MMTPHLLHLINLRRQGREQQESALEQRLKSDIRHGWQRPMGTSPDMTAGEKLRAQLLHYGLIKPQPKRW